METNDDKPEKMLGGITGKGFLPGHRYHRGGRPRGVAEAVRRLVGADGREVVLFLASVMRGEVIGRKRPTIRDRVEAAKELLDRGFGRAIQTTDLNLSGFEGIDLRLVRLEEGPALRLTAGKGEEEEEEGEGESP